VLQSIVALRRDNIILQPYTQQ